MNAPALNLDNQQINNQQSNVLVVDDDGPILKALQARLQHAGYSVTAARDGTTALSGASNPSPDIAVLDVNLPSIDGFSVAEKLRAAFPDIGLIFLTASKAADLQSKAAALGAEFIEKPFDSSHLMEKLSELHR